MSIVSLKFLLFIILVTILNQVLQPLHRPLLLCVCGLVLAGMISPETLAVLLILIILTFTTGIWIGSVGKQSVRKRILSVHVILVVFILIVFRTGVLSAIPGISLRSLVVVGLSFYALESISYIADIYNNKLPANRSIIDVALFLGFSPTLISGPIKRAREFFATIEQIKNHSRRDLFNPNEFRRGFILIIWGYFLKLMIADRASVFVNSVYTTWFERGSVILVLAAFMYSLQLYCDFLSYSCIASGIAKLLGYSVPDNFNTPFFSTSMSELWKRWHISLSSWLRDYIYIPLGGGKKSSFRRDVNLLITFLVSGLWHGFGITFIVWGGLNGICIIIERIVSSYINKRSLSSRVEKKRITQYSRRVYTYLLFSGMSIFFRAESIIQAVAIVQRIFTKPDFWVLFDGTLFSLGLDGTELLIMIGSLLILILVSSVHYSIGLPIDKWFINMNLFLRITVAVALIYFMLLFGIYGPGFDAKDFIYAHF